MMWFDKYPERWHRIVFNTQFAMHVLKNNGSLWCEYCGLTDLKIFYWYERNNCDRCCTVDHFKPISLFPELAEDNSNLFICCPRCNTKKANKMRTDDFIKYPIDFAIKSTFVFDPELLGLWKDNDKFGKL